MASINRMESDYQSGITIASSLMDFSNKNHPEVLNNHSGNIKNSHDGCHYVPGTGSLGRLTHKFIENNSDEELNSFGQVIYLSTIFINI